MGRDESGLRPVNFFTTQKLLLHPFPKNLKTFTPSFFSFLMTAPLDEPSAFVFVRGRFFMLFGRNCGFHPISSFLLKNRWFWLKMEVLFSQCHMT
jgi:hypothetical protein